MAEFEDIGVYAIPTPRPEEDTRPELVAQADAVAGAAQDSEWADLLREGGAGEAPEAQQPASDPTPAKADNAPDDAAPTISPADIQAAIEDKSFLDLVGDVGADVAEGIIEAPLQVAGGVADAFDEAGQLLGELTGFGGIQFLDPETGEFDPGLLSHDEITAQREAGAKSLIDVLTVGTPDTVTGGFIRTTAQFLTGFLPGVGALKAAKVGSVVARGVIAGSAADAVVFDPNEDRLATWLNEVPFLEPFVSDYLADNDPENESSWEGRLKNVIEGAGIGIAAEGVGAIYRAVKYYKAQRVAASQFAPDSPSAQRAAASDQLQDAARQELTIPISDTDMAPLGDPTGPLLVPSQSGEEAGAAFTRLKAAEQRVELSALRADALGKIETISTPRTPDQMDGLIDAVRKGGVTADLGGKRPVSGIVKDLGGVAPGSNMAAELKARGVTSKTHPGLFRKGGLTDMDNIPVADHPIFSARMQDDGNGFVPQDSWIDALADEAAGNPWRSIEQQRIFDEDVLPVDALGEELERLGLDVSEMSNDKIRARLQEIADEEDLLNRDVAPDDAQPADLEDIQDADIPDSQRGEQPEFDPETGEPLLPDDAAPQGRVFINHARINTTDDVHALLQEAADLDAAHIESKTRGVVTNEQTIRESSAEYQDLNDLIGRPPGPMTAAQATAARKILTTSGEQLVALAKRASAAGASKADLFNFRRAMSVHYAIQSEVVAARTETARALQSWAIPAGSDKIRSETITDLIMRDGGGGDIQTLAAVVGSMAENPAGINVAVRETLKGKVGAAAYQIWINGLLSGPKTHLVNAIGNSITAAWAVPERLLTAGISSAFYGGDVAVREATEMLYGMVKGARDGVRLVAMGSRRSGDETLDRFFDAFGRPEIHVNAISAEAFGLGNVGPISTAVDAAGKLISLPGSALGASDKFFKSTNYRAQLHSLAYRTARNEGLEGNPMAERVADLLLDPPQTMIDDAVDFSSRQTFTNKLGQTGRAIQSTLAKIPGGRVIVPFIQTPTNIVKYTLQRTPLAYMSSAIRADIKAGGSRAAQAQARIAMGSMLMAVTADMTMEGTITGKGPSDPRLRRAKMATGWKPYSVNIGDRWVQYSRLDPIGMIMGLGADATEVMTNANKEDGEWLGAAVVTALANNLANKTYMSGIYDFIGAIDPSNPTSTPQKFMENFSGSIMPFSSAMRTAAQQVDPVLRDTRSEGLGEDGEPDQVARFFETVLNKMRANIPGLSSSLPPRRDLFGEEITRESGLGIAFDAMSPVATRAHNPDPITQVILDNQIAVSSPPRIIGGVQLTPEEYSEFSQIAGEMLHEQLGNLIALPSFKSLSEGPDGMKAELVLKVMNQTRKAARAMMLSESPRLQNMTIERKHKRALLLQGDE